mgnify:CR=1 FL=1
MKKYIALFVAVVVLAGGAFFTQKWFIGSFTVEDSFQVPESNSFVFIGTTTGSVLDAMRAFSAEGSFNFSGRDFPGLGFFVEEINNLPALHAQAWQAGKKNAEGYYWILLINGKKSDLGVSQARIQQGDVIEWRYEKGY